MRLRFTGVPQAWKTYASELLIVAAGVALGLWATQWAEDRQVESQVSDAYDVLSDELGDNLYAMRFRQAIAPCVQRRIADLRRWNEQQSRGVTNPLPLDIGTPGSLTILDSVWDISKSGQVVAKMPLEARRRYAAVYDLFENVATFQRLERSAWFAIGQYGGLSDSSPSERARLNGLLLEVETYDQSLRALFPGILDDFARLKVEQPSAQLDLSDLRKRDICKPLAP
jgi:hypothetical protein